MINELFWAIQYFSSLLFKLNMVCDTTIPWNNNCRNTTHSPTLLPSWKHDVSTCVGYKKTKLICLDKRIRMQQYTPQFLLSLLHKILYFEKFLYIGAFAPFIMITKCDCKNHLKRVEASTKNYFLLTIYRNPPPSPLSHKKLTYIIVFFTCIWNEFL